MKTLKNLFVASTLALALSSTLYAGSYELGSTVNAGQCDPNCSAYFTGSDIYLVSPSQGTVINPVGNAVSFSEGAGTISITVDGGRVYIYTSGDDPGIQQFIESL